MAQPKDDALRGKWWEIFDDPQLNALEEKVNVSNQNIAAAAASFLRGARPGQGSSIPAFPHRDDQPGHYRATAVVHIIQWHSGEAPSSSTGTIYRIHLPV